MKTSMTMFLLAALILAPGLAAEEAAAPAADAARTAAVLAPEAQKSCGAELALAEAMAAPALEVEAGATATCTTRCADGSTLSCYTTPCFAEPGCGLFCNGTFYRCNNPCP